MTWTHYVVRTAFHSGGIVSKHKSRKAAERSAKRWTGNTECQCGCCGVVPAEELSLLVAATDARSPYTLAL